MTWMEPVELHKRWMRERETLNVVRNGPQYNGSLAPNKYLAIISWDLYVILIKDHKIGK